MYPIHRKVHGVFITKGLKPLFPTPCTDCKQSSLQATTVCLSPAPVIVFDFETTGKSPKYGDRPIEVGAVKIEQGIIVGRFQELMNPGFPISRFIESLTGIGNERIAQAPPCETVMARFATWIGEAPLVAHNVGFDRAFLDAELQQLGIERTNPMACTVLTARRIFPSAPNHKLATLVDFLGIANNGIFHRA